MTAGPVYATSTRTAQRRWMIRLMALPAVARPGMLAQLATADEEAAELARDPEAERAGLVG